MALYPSNHDMYKGGIYAIRNTANGREYVGVAHNMFISRWQAHRWRLRKGTHHCRALQEEWNQYGESAFKFVPLEVKEAHERVTSGGVGLLHGLEQEWYLRRQASGIDLYNELRW